jgi:lipoyl synthase
LRIKNHASYHGLSMNIDMDLSPFEAIDPCGFKNLQMTQLKTFTNDVSIEAIGFEIANDIKHQLLNLKMIKPNISKPIGVKEINFEKTSKIPIKIIEAPIKAKPHWIKMQLPQSQRFNEIKSILRKNNLHSVCEEASCPNIGECFSQGTATFMILGDLCTRRCPFCDVGHGRPLPPDADEPKKLAQTILELNLKYVVITSVDRDDLRDGGAQHFVDCIKEIRSTSPNTKIEILVPDFRGRLD